MRRYNRNRWLIVVALIAAGWLLWSRLHLVFVVQLSPWSLLLFFGLVVLAIYAALRLLFTP